MASIAHVDNHLDPAEKKALKVAFQNNFLLKGKREIWAPCFLNLVEEQGRKDFDFHEVISEINQLTSYKIGCISWNVFLQWRLQMVKSLMTKQRKSEKLRKLCEFLMIFLLRQKGRAKKAIK
ncbi:MAG: hypothetical protein CM1200mP16_02430 [Nitrospina sp.]|nr:MAG: hypothetical protein CM1200mP16_02430 [Nitrospina sp.]